MSLLTGIIGARTSGVIVKTILAGGVADRDGRLKSGDHILQIGDVSFNDIIVSLFFYVFINITFFSSLFLTNLTPFHMIPLLYWVDFIGA